MKPSLIDYQSIIFGIATFIVCFIIINSLTEMPINSIIAAAMAGFIAFGSWITIRMIYLSMKKP